MSLVDIYYGGMGPDLVLLALNVLVEAVEPMLRRCRLVEVLHKRMDHIIRPDSI